ncbi:hypothetical protein GCM10023318_51020 [Nocardia callitridis]|uniref:ABC transporter domain-containing protein n=1 Tax=Nocardia callitridis TaxID=648753 RepID=A0ABP9KVJ2_9NOCA
MSLDVPAGGLGVVVGQGGSGRTSLLLALAGRLRIMAGTISVGGHRIPGAGRAVRRLVSVARAAPAVDLDDELRVGELMDERALIGGADGDAVAETMDLLRVDAPAAMFVGELPAHQRSLLAVALAAAEWPSAVFLDDADRGCGAREADHVWWGLRTLAAHGCTVLASSTLVPAVCFEDESIPVFELPHPTQRDQIAFGEE